MKLQKIENYKRAEFIINTYGSMSDFPAIANDQFTCAELIEYIGDCEFMLDNIDARKKKPIVPAVVFIIPTIVMSFYHNDIMSLMMALVCGGVLTAILLFCLGIADNIKQTKVYNAEMEHYIDILLTKYEE